ncbi:MAG: EF-hand domain-containing protein [Akkermansiaceae bacterium]
MNHRTLIGLFSISFVASAFAQEVPVIEREKPFRPDRMEKKGPKGEGRQNRPPRGPSGEMFKRMDKDRDGNITKKEFFSGPRLEQLEQEKREKIFERLDQNDDGLLDRAEIRKIRKDGEDRRRRELRSLDKDQSGGLSFEEFSKGEFVSRLPEEKRKQIFERMDTDGNGEINADDRPPGPPRKRGGKDDRPRKPKKD